MDVDAMLDELAPEEFDEWIAYRTLEPDPYERLIAILKLGFAAVASAFSGKEFDPELLDTLKPDDPGLDEHGNPIMTPQESQNLMQARLGPSNVKDG